MWIVRLALNRPYTFAVLALLIAVLGATSVHQMRTDIFPEIDIPVITVIWTYKGMETNEVERRITTYSEYAITSNVSDIKRIESQTLNGVGVIKIQFHQGADVGAAMAQVTATTQSIRALMPPGIQPPVIVRFNASSVPILQIGLSSETMSEEEVYDYGLYILRTQLSTVRGLTMPTSYGGRERQVMVDIDPQLLHAKGISPKEVSDAINAYNLAYPTGVARIDTHEYPVTLNNTPVTPANFNDIPLKVIGGATIYLRDVAQVRDGSTTQTTVVRRNGARGALVTLLKNGKASTLDIVNEVKAIMPQIRASAPPDLQIDLLFDQSVFARLHGEFERHFEQMRDLYTALLDWNLRHRKQVFAAFAAVVASGLIALPWVGRDFFPTVDTGQFRLHVRAPAGTRVEQTERYFGQVETAIREIIPKREVELVLDNIGLPNRTYAMAFGDSATTGMADGEILVALAHHRSHSTPEYMAHLRRELPKRFPELTFFFQSADIVSQILNFGLPAPIDVQIAGLNRVTSNRPSTFTPTCKAATWGALPARSTTFWPSIAPSWRRATRL